MKSEFVNCIVFFCINISKWRNAEFRMDPVEFARILANIKQESNDVKPTKLTTGHSGADRTPHKCAPFAFFPISDDEDETAVIYRTKLPCRLRVYILDQRCYISYRSLIASQRCPTRKLVIKNVV